MRLVQKVLLFLIVVLFQFEVKAQYGGGNGASDNPYLIETPAHLVSLSNTTNDWAGMYFKLENDLDMTGQSFTPIGNSTQIFTGSFEGNSKVVSNLVVTPNTINEGTGFFGQFSGQVTRLGIEYITINAPGINRIGAVVGYMTGGSVTYCYAKGGTINVGSGGWAGGVVGVMFKSANVLVVEDCYSSVAITASWGSGGVVGATRGAHTINRVAFYGTISNNNPAITTVQYNISNNNLDGIPPTNAFFATSTGAADPNATSLDVSALENASSYSTFDFGRVWKIDSILKYAILQNPIADPELAFFDKIRLERVTSNQNIEWINFAPGTSGYCEEFWCHPTDANVMFSGPDMHAAFGSWDNGQTWQTIKDSDGDGVDLRRVIDIQFSLQDPDYGILFDNNQTGSSTSGKIFETTDKGRTWSVVSTMGKAHSKLAIHPTNDNIWFLGAGDFWNVKDNHRSLANPNGTIQGRADYGYVWKTTDKGATWSKVATGISSNLDVGRIIFDRNNPNVMVMATGQGMYRSTDLGENWVLSASGLPNNLPRDLTSYYNSTTNEFILFALEQTTYTPNVSTITSTGGVYKSIDSGLTWQSITGNLGLNMQSITDYWSRDSYHKTVANWLGITKSFSQSTYTTYPSWALQTFNRIVVNPTNKNEIYLLNTKRHDFSFGPGDVWKTINGGTTWTASSRAGIYWINETDKAYWENRDNPIETNIDFSHMQRSLDESDESASGARMLAINSNGDVFTGINQQLLRSNNGGVSWEQADDIEAAPTSNTWIGRGNTNLPGRFILTETGVPGRKLLCSGEHGLWQTTGTTSSPIANNVVIEQIEGQVHDHSGNHGAHSISTVAVHPNDPDTIYVLMWRQEHRGKLRRTTDGGATWQNIATIFDAANGSWEELASQYSLMIDPVNPNNMYFTSIAKPISCGTSTGPGPTLTMGEYGVYRSNDAGFTWSVSNSDFPAGSSVNRIVMDPDNPQTIYATLNQWSNSDTGGLYKSVNAAVNWTQMTIPSQIKSVNNLFIDKTTKHMFMSTGARQGTIDAGGVWRSTDNGANWERIFEAPYVWQAETSSVNSDIIVISVAGLVPNMASEFLNPGVYLSLDAGVSWTKINKGLAHSDRIVDVKPDPVDENVLWAAGWGSGWYKAIIDTSGLAVEDVIENSNSIKLYPNPVNNGKILLSNLMDTAKYTIWNIQGKSLKSGSVTANNTIDVSQFNAGIYIIKISTESGTSTQKFIIPN